MKKVGIITLHTYNYGSLLQCYALKNRLKKLGYESEIAEVSYSMKSKIQKYAYFCIHCIRHPSKFYNYVKFLTSRQIQELQKDIKINMDEFEQKLKIVKLEYSQWEKCALTDEYICFISGSDQIWGNSGMRFEPFHFLQFAPRSKRVAYAPSFGVKYIADYEKLFLHKYLEGYKSLSVREKSGAKIVLDTIGKRVPVLLDPTLLIDRNEWSTMIECVKEKCDKTNLFLYFLSEPNEEIVKIIEKICKAESIIVEIWGTRFRVWDKLENAKFMTGNPLMFVDSIERAKLVLTDSYHAMIFSINFNINFWIFKRNYGHNFEQSSRIEDFLDNIRLENRYICRQIDFDFEEKCDFTTANEFLCVMRSQSMEYLRKSIMLE